MDVYLIISLDLYEIKLFIVCITNNEKIKTLTKSMIARKSKTTSDCTMLKNMRFKNDSKNACKNAFSSTITVIL